jgi:AraC-like DNA-binding protein
MPFDLTPKSVFLLVFFIHGIVFSVLLLYKGWRNRDWSVVWLGVFLVLCAMYIAPFMLGYAGWYFYEPYRDIMFFVPFQQLFLIGPVIFFYTQSLLNKSFRLSKKYFIHFVPAILYLIYSLVVFITDKFIFSEYYFYADGRDKDLAFWYQMSGLISMAFYLILSLRFYTVYKKVVYQAVSFADSILFGWIHRFLAAFLIILVLRVLFFILNPEWGAFGSKFWYYLCFSILVYYISLNGYFNSVRTMFAFKTLLFGYDSKYLLPAKNNSEKDTPQNSEDEIIIEESASKQPIEIADLEDWKLKVERAMKTEKAYENEELTLTGLAEDLQITPKKLSQIVNQGFKMNFNDFVNFCRTEAVIQKFRAGEHDLQNLLVIAFDCGFNSKSTFNRAFKKQTQMTPKDYLKKYYQK